MTPSGDGNCCSMASHLSLAAMAALTRGSAHPAVRVGNRATAAKPRR
ncbi:hypothetical protein GCM10023340_29280 [Nocardioides marinquilinus]|uniref:Uncharacterized protein n=1 Tax=Nocardioides marinquilinus TaxID=1210400 RepID=A0ABP9PRS7_9ACTN